MKSKKRKTTAKYLPKIKDAIRAKRKRQADKDAGVSKQTLTLDPYAHLVVTGIAEQEGITASEAVEKYMGPILKQYLDNRRRKK